MIEPAKGILLIADPFLQDANFVRSVVCICEHNEDGNVGFVLNKKANLFLNDVLPGFPGNNIVLFEGGPVELNTIHFIHQFPQLIPDSIKLCENVYWNGNFETVMALIQKNDIDLSKLKFFQGYSGWSAGQLLDEINEKSWLTVQGNEKLVFATNSTDLWKESLKELGGEYKQLINYPIDPQLN